MDTAFQISLHEQHEKDALSDDGLLSLKSEPTTPSESSDEPSPLPASSKENLIELQAENESLRKKLAEMSQLLAQAQDEVRRNFSYELAELQSRLEAVLNDQQSLGQRVEHLEVLMEQVLIANPNIPR
ncbi:hypothetical protein DAPPUDRAFT_313439 [Daphnia pulex]|uniref:Uncharacterized protein n=1 Tax=Daphnia pulex TaxID=6669 RepID=E9G493_DAPPU|nr:hypothetical protein DAPPUDRAFT_313439 [Daphnia pulex]|eukprot:EFX85713.1 hypothetical protein DAPPUDRAFT_313439 [Daphnia pulex]